MPHVTVSNWRKWQVNNVTHWLVTLSLQLLMLCTVNRQIIPKTKITHQLLINNTEICFILHCLTPYKHKKGHLALKDLVPSVLYTLLRSSIPIKGAKYATFQHHSKITVKIGLESRTHPRYNLVCSNGAFSTVILILHSVLWYTWSQCCYTEIKQLVQSEKHLTMVKRELTLSRRPATMSQWLPAKYPLVWMLGSSIMDCSISCDDSFNSVGTGDISCTWHK